MEHESKKIYFSIVIPCYNCERTITRCVKSVIAQDYTSYELILINDMSTDSTQTILNSLRDSYDRIKAVSLKQKGFAGGARNTGKTISRGDVIVFLDSDVTVKSTYLSTLHEMYSSFPHIDGVGGAVEDPYGQIVTSASYFLGMSEFLPVGKIRYVTMIPTINLSYRRDVIKDIWFLEKNTAAEDSLFNYTLAGKGVKLLFNPHLTVSHYHQRRDIVSMLKREAFYAQGFVMSRRLYRLPGHFLLDYKFLLLLLPRFLLLIKRIIVTRYWPKFLIALPLILLGEIVRTIKIIREDSKFMRNIDHNKKEFGVVRKSGLAFSE